jgi:hypothetical protein
MLRGTGAAALRNLTLHHQHACRHQLVVCMRVRMLRRIRFRIRRLLRMLLKARVSSEVH